MRTFAIFAVLVLAATAAKVNGGDGIASAASSMVGKYPYSWGGGNDNGATYGTKQTVSPYCDDRNVIGFDCSGLSKFAVHQGTGKSLAHGASSQYNSCSNYVSTSSLQAGDLVFFGSTSNIHHVAIYVGSGQMVEASGHNPDCSGIPVRKVSLRTSQLLDKGCRYW